MVAKQLKPSRYRTTCRTCGSAIRPGDMITGGKGRSVCETCSHGSLAEPVAPAPRPICPVRGLDLESSGVHSLYLESLSEAVDYVTAEVPAAADNVPFIASRYSENAARSRTDFFERHLPSTLASDIANPKKSILDAVDSMRRSLTESVVLTSPARNRRRGVNTGDEINVDRFLSRQPECWDRIERAPKPKRVVSIAINGITPGNFESRHLCPRGAAVIALADYLTEQGYSVGITLFACSRGLCQRAQRDISIVNIAVKHPDHPMDINSIVAPVCDAGINRLVALKALALAARSTLDDGLGACQSLPAELKQRFDFCIDCDVSSESSARSWLQDCINKTQTAAA